MRIDIHTLISVLLVMNILQTIAFILHRSSNHGCGGSGSWLLWSLFSATGYLLMFLRVFLSGVPLALSIFFSNSCLFAGQVMLYDGLCRFVGVRGQPRLVAVIAALFVAGTVLSMTVRPDPNLRPAILYLCSAAFCVLGARTLRTGRTFRSDRTFRADRTFRSAPSAGFLSVLLVIQAAFLTFRSVFALAVSPIVDTYEAVPVQVILFLVPISVGYLSAFGIFLMVNQSSLARYDEIATNFKRIFNIYPDAVWITRLDDEKIVNVNEGFSRLTGYGRDDALGRRSDELGIWQDNAVRNRIFEMLRNVGWCENQEAMFRHRNGTTIYGIASLNLFMMEGALHIITVLHDITMRKEMETALQKSEEKFRLLIENSYDVIYTMSSSGRFLFVSPVVTRLLGYEPCELVGKFYFDFVHPDDHAACRSFIESVVTSGESRADIEFRIRHKNGSWLWHTSSGVPFTSEKGEIQGFYGIDRDIDERRRLLGELEKQATTDELTGVLNRRYFMQRAGTEFTRAVRLRRALSVALVDIDHFKGINDTRGHAAGDESLVFFARVCAGNIREIDVLARFGGDEFILLLPDTAEARAVEVLERLRKAIEADSLASEGGPIRLTISGGVASVRTDGSEKQSLDSLLIMADQALYRAKEAGRNRIAVYLPPPAAPLTE
jgi:PAS domain S-box/diguanylate cyclase (GGDEF) domain